MSVIIDTILDKWHYDVLNKVEKERNPIYQEIRDALPTDIHLIDWQDNIAKIPLSDAEDAFTLDDFLTMSPTTKYKSKCLTNDFIAKYLERLADSDSDLVYVNPLVASTVAAGEDPGGDSLAEILNYSSQQKLLQLHFWPFMINENHWLLITCDINNGTFVLYDSQNMSFERLEYAYNVIRFYKSRAGPFRDTVSWNTCATENNKSTECGVYTLMKILQFRSRLPRMRYEDVRTRITYEILTNKILEDSVHPPADAGKITLQKLQEVNQYLQSRKPLPDVPRITPRTMKNVRKLQKIVHRQASKLPPSVRDTGLELVDDLAKLITWSEYTISSRGKVRDGYLVYEPKNDTLVINLVPEDQFTVAMQQLGLQSKHKPSGFKQEKDDLTDVAETTPGKPDMNKQSFSDFVDDDEVQDFLQGTVAPPADQIDHQPPPLLSPDIQFAPESGKSSTPGEQLSKEPSTTTVPEKPKKEEKKKISIHPSTACMYPLFKCPLHDCDIHEAGKQFFRRIRRFLTDEEYNNRFFKAALRREMRKLTNRKEFITSRVPYPNFDSERRKAYELLKRQGRVTGPYKYKNITREMKLDLALETYEEGDSGDERPAPTETAPFEEEEEVQCRLCGCICADEKQGHRHLVNFAKDHHFQQLDALNRTHYRWDRKNLSRRQAIALYLQKRPEILPKNRYLREQWISADRKDKKHKVHLYPKQRGEVAKKKARREKRQPPSSSSTSEHTEPAATEMTILSDDSARHMYEINETLIHNAFNTSSPTGSNLSQLTPGKSPPSDVNLAITPRFIGRRKRRGFIRRRMTEPVLTKKKEGHERIHYSAKAVSVVTRRLFRSRSPLAVPSKDTPARVL